MGYDHVRRNGERFIVVNETGKLLRKAFLWKANESLSNETIRQKLWAAGLKVSKQRVSEIFKNPFYCGLIVHNSLEGKVVDGKHEKVISKELFLKVNEIQSKNPHGFKWEVENEKIPLKRFLRCEGCGTYMRGYEVKAKKIYYYKCSTIGCNCNKNAEQLHNMFLGKLKPHVLDSKYIDLAKYQLDATFRQLNNNQKENKEICHKKQEEINKKIERLQERFILEEIERDLYDKFLLKYKGEKGTIEEQIQNSAIEVSNLMEYTDISIQIALKLTEIWVSGTYTDKYGLQVLMFPNGMYYNKKTDECRTPKENSIFPALACLSMDSSQKRSGLNRSIPEKSA
ncbi:MAG: recombinase family protein [Bacteroidota bacterium]